MLTLNLHPYKYKTTVFKGSKNLARKVKSPLHHNMFAKKVKNDISQQLDLLME